MRGLIREGRIELRTINNSKKKCKYGKLSTSKNGKNQIINLNSETRTKKQKTEI